MFPKQSEIEIPLLESLVELGGRARPGEIYPLVSKRFPQLTLEDLEEVLPSGSPKWTNRVQWVRQALISKGEMHSPERGVWGITDSGRQRLERAKDGRDDEASEPRTMVALYDEYLSQFKANLLESLLGLSPEEFEHFAKKLLTAYGFVRVQVTAVSNDGGIDGYGLLKIGLARMRVAFQCKRWQANRIPRPEIDKFRGAIQGEYEQGIFFTTSEFTEGATNASIKAGAVPVILLDGESIVDLMIEKQFGVRREPLELLVDQVDRLFADLESET